MGEKNRKIRGLSVMFSMTAFMILTLSSSASLASALASFNSDGCPVSQEMTLFQDDFADGDADGWRLDPTWAVEQEDGNYVLSGSGHTWAGLAEERNWTDYSFRTRVKLIQGAVHLNYRLSRNGRYFIGFGEDVLSLSKSVLKDPPPPPGEDEWDHFLLTRIEGQFDLNVWHTVKIAGTGARIQIYLDGELKIDYTDVDNPHLAGSIAFETLPDSHVHFDDVEVVGPVCTELTWRRTGSLPGGGIVALEIAPSTPSTVYLAANVNDMGVWRSTDAGQTWGRAGQPVAHALALAIHPDDPNVALVAGLHGEIWKTTDGGNTWEMTYHRPEGEEASMDTLAISPSQPNVVYAGASDGSVLESQDGGESWTKVYGNLPLVATLVVDPTNPDVVWAGTLNGVYRTLNGGVSWVARGLMDQGVISIALDPTNPHTLYAATSQGVFKTTDGGDNWQSANHGLTELDVHRVVVAPSAPNTVYAGTHSGVFKSVDGGGNWAPVNSGLRYLNIGGLAVDPSDADTVYAGTGLWQWIPYHGHFPQDIRYDEGIYKTTDGGVNWVKLDGDFADDDVIVVTLDPSDPQTLYAGTECSRGAYRSTDGGLTWGLLPGGAPSNADLAHYTMDIAVGTAPPHPVYLTGRFGVAKSLDRGITWQDLSYRRHFHGVAIDPTDSQTVYVGTAAEDDPNESNVYPGAHILKTADGGRTWQEVDNGFPHGAETAIHSILIDPSAPDTVYLATATHGHPAATTALGVYKTMDGGLTWTPANNGLTTLEVTVLVMDPSNPNILYAGTADGAFKTTNGAESWIPVGLEGISVHDLAIDPGAPNHVYAGTDAGIFKTNDGGNNWYAVNFGLPSTKVRSLALEPSGNVLYAAVQGAGVFRAVINQVAGVSVIAPPDQRGLPGEVITYTFSIQNTGNDQDTFDPQAVSSNGWPTDLVDGPSVGPLDYGLTTTVDVRVVIPSETPPEATDVLTLTVTSQFDPAVSASASVTTAVCILGDLNCDCAVDIKDIMQVAERWHARKGDDNYLIIYDLDKDDDIDVVDVMKVAVRWEATCETP